MTAGRVHSQDAHNCLSLLIIAHGRARAVISIIKTQLIRYY